MESLSSSVILSLNLKKIRSTLMHFQENLEISSIEYLQPNPNHVEQLPIVGSIRKCIFMLSW